MKIKVSYKMIVILIIAAVATYYMKQYFPK